MNDEYYDDEPQDWPKGSMTFRVEIANTQEDFFVREVANRLADKVTKEMIEKIESTANDLIEMRLRARMDSIIKDVLEKGLSAEVQPSDTFSNPKGDPISPAEFIAQGAEAFMSEAVDSSGAPVTRDTFGSRNRGSTRMEWALGQVVNKQFEDEFKASVSTITKEIRLQMKDAAAAWMAKFQAETVTKIEAAKEMSNRM